MHTFNKEAEAEQRQADLSKFKASLVYRVNPGQSGLHSKTLPQKEKRKETVFYNPLAL